MKTLIVSAAIAALGLALPVAASAQGGYGAAPAPYGAQVMNGTSGYYGSPVYAQGYGNAAGQSYGGGNGYAGSSYANMTGSRAGYGVSNQRTSTRYGDTRKNSSGVEYTTGTANGYGVNAAGGCGVSVSGCGVNQGSAYGNTRVPMYGVPMYGSGYAGQSGFNQGAVSYVPLGYVGGPVMTRNHTAPAPSYAAPAYSQPTYSQPVYSAPAVSTYSASSQMAPCPSGTSAQADGTCLSSTVTSVSSAVVTYAEPTPVYTAPAYTAPIHVTTTCESGSTPGYTMSSSADFNRQHSYSGSCSHSSAPAPHGYAATPQYQNAPVHRK